MNKNNSNLEFRKIKSLKYLYEINENGTIFRNVKSKKQYKIKLDYHHSNKGYYVTFIKLNKKTKRIMIHSVVAECWLGDRPNRYEIDHIDRNSRNNDYRNLRYVTRSEQMKNRDHTNISKIGTENLEKVRELRKKPVIIYNKQERIYFSSFADCSRFISKKYDKTFEAIRYKLKSKRSHIFDYDIIYLRNAETIHDNSKE